jgi:hypothetical protein
MSPVSQQPGAELGSQFMAQLSAENGYEDVAGIRPLPITRMRAQADRHVTKQRQTTEFYGNPGYTRKEIKERDARLTQQAAVRNARVTQAIKEWDPTEAEWKERMNRWNASPRSRPAIPAVEAFNKWLQDDVVWPTSRLAMRGVSKAYEGKASSGREFSDALDNARRDVSEYVSDNVRMMVKQNAFAMLDKIAESRTIGGVERYHLPRELQKQGGLSSLGNDLFYEWKQTRQSATVDMIETSRSTIRGI